MYEIIAEMDVVAPLMRTLGAAGWGIDPDTNRLVPMMPRAQDPSKNWIYTNPMPDARCEVYRAIAQQFKFIPQRCMECWKVVVKPKTIQQLMALYDFQKKFVDGFIGHDRFCKCGIEDRVFVPRNYGGYFYCSTLEQGLERWEEVRLAVDSIAKDIDVTLKRYCTEYEMLFGPSDQYTQPENQEALETLIWRFVDIKKMGKNTLQGTEIIGHVVKRWLEFAFSIGDPTFEMFNNGRPRFAPCVTYHPEKKGE